MNRDFLQPLLNKNQKMWLKKLCGRDNFHGLLSIMQDMCFIVLAILFCVNVSYWFFPVSVLIIGARQRALASLLHEAAYGTLFSSKILNETVGRVVCGWTILQIVFRL